MPDPLTQPPCSIGPDHVVLPAWLYHRMAAAYYQQASVPADSRLPRTPPEEEPKPLQQQDLEWLMERAQPINTEVPGHWIPYRPTPDSKRLNGNPVDDSTS